MASLSDTELSILKIVKKRNLITKTELISELQNNGSDDPKSVVEAATGSLIEKGHLTCLNPIGSTCFVITKNGQDMLQK